MHSLKIKNISKSYKLFDNNKDVLIDFFTRKQKCKTFNALKNVSFAVECGTSYGVMGQNGSGKSTLLRIVSNNTIPTEGTVITTGVVSLLNVGAGISNNYTGLQNIYYKCTINGMTKKQIDEVLEDIIEFSELGEFINQPVRKYSSGMRAKLGFAIAIYNDFEVLIADEVFAVGDAIFRIKCLKRMNELKKEGKTILFVSHSSGQVKSFCDKCCWLHKGELIAKGDSEKIVELYDQYTKKNITIEVAKKIVDYDRETYYAD